MSDSTNYQERNFLKDTDVKMVLSIKRVPTVVSNYQKAETDEVARYPSGCGRNCLRSCCLPGAKLPLHTFKTVNKFPCDKSLAGSGTENNGPSIDFLNSLLLGEWEERMLRGLFRYGVTACETKVIPGGYGFIAQLNEGRHLKKRPSEFRVDKVLQPFDQNKFLELLVPVYEPHDSSISSCAVLW